MLGKESHLVNYTCLIFCTTERLSNMSCLFNRPSICTCPASLIDRTCSRRDSLLDSFDLLKVRYNKQKMDLMVLSVAIGFNEYCRQNVVRSYLNV